MGGDYMSKWRETDSFNVSNPKYQKVSGRANWNSSFVDIIHVSDNIGQSLRSTLTDKLDEYRKHVYDENEARSPPIDHALLERDIHNYLCHTFWTYWSGGDLDMMMHPSSDTVSNFARVMVANSFGYMARNSMMDYVEMLQEKQRGEIEGHL